MKKKFFKKKVGKQWKKKFLKNKKTPSPLPLLFAHVK
jgi:hypothetical protein